MKFSVITPSWNQGSYLRGCIESVLAQSDPGFEHLIFDNCSTDGTSSIVADYPHLLFHSEKDSGQSDAVNKGFRLSGGDVFCWLNTDDAYAPGLFARLREAFSDSAIDIVFGDVAQIGYAGLPDQRAQARFERRLDLVRWWSSLARIHQPAVFFRRQVFEKIGPLREDLHYAMDYEYWWRASEFFSFHYIPEILAIQHRQPQSKTVLDWQKVYAEREKIFLPCYGMIDGGDRRALMKEKSRVMAKRLLGEAFAAVPTSPAAALRLLLRSWKENPLSLIDPAWLGVIRRSLAARVR